MLQSPSSNGRQRCRWRRLTATFSTGCSDSEARAALQPDQFGVGAKHLHYIGEQRLYWQSPASASAPRAKSKASSVTVAIASRCTRSNQERVRWAVERPIRLKG